MSAREPLGATSHGGGLRLPVGSLGATALPGPRPAADARWAGTDSSRRGLVAITGLLLTGLVVSLAAAHTEVLLPESIRPAPPSLSGALGSIGLNLHPAGAIAVLTLMFASYAVVVAASAELSARAVLCAVVALHVLVLLAPPLLSTDVFSYQAYARIGASYGVNPYLNGPHAIALDSVFPYVGARWSYIPSAYGPVFTAASYPLASLSIAASVIAYKSIAVVASLALAGVVWHCAQLRGVDPRRAVALVALNPLLVIYGVGGGHNDVLMLLAVAGALYALITSRHRVGGGLAMLAIGVKLTGGIVLPFALAADGRSRGHRRRRDVALGAAVGFALIAALTFAMFGSGALHLLATLRQSQREGGWQSIPGILSDRLGLVAAGRIATYALAAGFVAACAWLLRRVWQGRMDWIAGAGWATLALLAASSSLLPWYVAWMLPLAALGRDRRLWRMAIVMTGIVQGVQLFGYIPHYASLL